MPLSPGTRLGPYEILAPLGAGGMGEVYRARDSRLGRDVALKVLPAEVAGDPVRRQRFEREAHAVAINDVGEGCLVTEAGIVRRDLRPLGSSTWCRPPGLLRFPIDRVLACHAMGWTPDGKVIGLGLEMRSMLWKFQPEGK